MPQTRMFENLDTLFAFSDGPPSSPGEVDTDRNLLLAKRYQLLERIGSGGMGSVFRAIDTELDETVAVKMLRPEIGQNPEALAQFRQEVKLGRRVTHPHVARLFDIGDAHGDRFLTMEYIDGPSLSHRLLQSHGLPLAEARRIAVDMCQGLAAIHDAGIVHLDLKPANVLLRSNGQAVISDFGIAGVLLGKGPAQTRKLAGTPAYMAPEQLDGGEVRHSADIYACGLILYELVTGAPAWRAHGAIQTALLRLTEPVPDPLQARPDLPEPWSRLIRACLARTPADRPVSAGVLRDQVAALPTERDEGRHVTAPTTDARAIDAYLRGRHAAVRQWYGDAFDAVHHFAQAADAAPDDPMVLASFATAAARLHAHGEQRIRHLSAARRAAERAIHLAPASGETHAAMAVVHLSAMHMADAVKTAAMAQRFAPHLARPHELLGRVLLETGPAEEALNQLRTALVLEPGAEGPRWELVRGLGLAGDWRAVELELAQPVHHVADVQHREVHRARLSAWCGRALGPAMTTSPHAPRLAMPLVFASLYDQFTAYGGLSEHEFRLIARLVAATEPQSRIRTLFLQLQVELLAASGQIVEAQDALTEAVDAALHDLMWMDHCPLLEPLRAEVAFEHAHAVVSARARDVRRTWRLMQGPPAA